MNDVSAAPVRAATAPSPRRAGTPGIGLLIRHWPLVAGLLALAVPSFMAVARDSWSTEQGAHGPVVLATGIWLVMRMWPEAAPLTRPGRTLLTAPMLLFTLAIYALGRISGTPEIEGYALYAVLLVTCYAYIGAAAMRLLWFPLFYFGFLFPPPDSVVATITQPLKIGISQAVVALLHRFGLPIGRTGVIIQVDQYDILVAAACSGLNSIITLSAIGLFYIYIRHNANWRYAALLMVVIIPMAILANFVRVLTLVLLTYFGGDALAQGFLHEFAGMLTFTVALLGIFGIDMAAAPLRRRLARGGEA